MEFREQYKKACRYHRMVKKQLLYGYVTYEPKAGDIINLDPYIIGQAWRSMVEVADKYSEPFFARAEYQYQIDWQRLQTIWQLRNHDPIPF